ncbi:MAG: helix-turn-helix transcriptional regulator [Bacteroidales bacterium]|nr:helix-turn-helix transcriptional regulator [Bacteroidales bacterium]
MRNERARKILAETPAETKKFVSKYADILVRIHELMKERGLKQKDIAEKLEKQPSEISKWLNGHNLTLKSIAKLEVVLDTDILIVSKTRKGIKISVSKVNVDADKEYKTYDIKPKSRANKLLNVS